MHIPAGLFEWFGKRGIYQVFSRVYKNDFFQLRQHVSVINVFFNYAIFFSVDDFILVENAVGPLIKAGIKRNEKGLFDDWKLELVRCIQHLHNIQVENQFVLSFKMCSQKTCALMCFKGLSRLESESPMQAFYPRNQKYFTLNRSSWVQDFKNSYHLVKLRLEFQKERLEIVQNYRFRTQASAILDIRNAMTQHQTRLFLR